MYLSVQPFFQHGFCPWLPHILAYLIKYIQSLSILNCYLSYSQVCLFCVTMTWWFRVKLGSNLGCTWVCRGSLAHYGIPKYPLIVTSQTVSPPISQGLRFGLGPQFFFTAQILVQFSSIGGGLGPSTMFQNR